jgi:hypothetical protein
MNQESANLTASGSDVFVSYASQDAAVANSIVESAGVASMSTHLCEK